MFLHLFLLSLIQGITEFLPISSSAHLILLSKLTSFPDEGLAFDIALHVGTLGAVVCYFFPTLWRILKNLIKKGGDKSLFINLFIATLPAVFIGGFFYSSLEDLIRNITLIAITSILFGGLLYLGDKIGKAKKGINDITKKDALFIGLTQVLAFIPGTSRSGVTMTSARFLGIKREAAAEFSMLLSIPVILGSGVLALYDFINLPLISQGSLLKPLPLFLGVGMTFIFALISISVLMKALKRFSFTPFVLYRIGLGIFLIYALATHFRF